MLVTCVCQNCGKVFRVWPAEIRYGRGKYCSRPCKNEGQANNWEKRFWENIEQSSDPDGCWIWKGYFRNGYGRFYKKGKVVSAHRVAYELAYGPIPPDKDCLHKCDQPACCRSSHLWLGTHNQNMQDMVKKGRNFTQIHPEIIARGEHHGQAKLNEKQIKEIRSMYPQKGITQQKLAILYNISRSDIGQIIRRKIWTHI